MDFGYTPARAFSTAGALRSVAKTWTAGEGLPVASAVSVTVMARE
jgi:hypothetical protein